jgi:hypothetical protein
MEVFVHLDGVKLSNFKYMCIKRGESSKSIFERETKKSLKQNQNNPVLLPARDLYPNYEILTVASSVL